MQHERIHFILKELNGLLFDGEPLSTRTAKGFDLFSPKVFKNRSRSAQFGTMEEEQQLTYQQLMERYEREKKEKEYERKLRLQAEEKARTAEVQAENERKRRREAEALTPLKPPVIVLTHEHSIDVEKPHLPRNALVSRLYDLIAPSSGAAGATHVLISAPASSGKTSLLQLFEKQHPEFNYIYVNFLAKVKHSAKDVMLEVGFDIDKHTITPLSDSDMSYNPNLHNLVIIDDAQEKYDDEEFWNDLIKLRTSFKVSNFTYIIVATHLVRRKQLSPACLSAAFRLNRSDFILTAEEAEKFLQLPNIGLLPKFSESSPFIKNLIIQQCGGLIGALAVTAQYLNIRFPKRSQIAYEEIALYLTSRSFLEVLVRCFGPIEYRSQCDYVKNLLMSSLMGIQVIRPSDRDMDAKDSEAYYHLLLSGVILETNDVVEFSSPLALKYYYVMFYPNRGDEEPKSLDILIEKAIQTFSVSVMRRSVPYRSDFPKEAVFQHLMMEGLTRNTNAANYVCAELSSVFSHSSSIAEKISGEIDFFVNGKLRWGIELLINGSGISEHIERFAPGGKYDPLSATDYVVIDFRGNSTGTATNVTRSAHRITVFFKIGDFARCELLPRGFGASKIIELCG